MIFFRIRSICSCTFKAIFKIFGLSQSWERPNNKAHNDTIPTDRASVQFSIEPSLEESSIAPMSSLSLVVSDQSSSMIGYGTELSVSESSSPDSVDPGKQLSPSSTFTSVSSSSLFAQDVSDDTKCKNGCRAHVTPVEHEDEAKSIAIITQSNNQNNSELRPYNLNVNATHFHEHSHTPMAFGSSVEKITPSESGTANTSGSSIFKVDTNIISDASPSSTESTLDESIKVEADKKKYPVTPYPKFAAFSSPSVQMKTRATKLPKSVITMRRGLVKTRVGNIQKKLDRQLREGGDCS